MAAAAEMGINDSSASIRNRMNDIEVEFHRSVLASEHQLAGLGGKTREMEDSARRSADRRSVIPR
jgi:hypothetical protein